MQLVCRRCDKIIEAKPTTTVIRLPRGWKRRGEEILCDACNRAAYVLRAVTIPVAGPADNPKERWPALREALAKSWSATTDLANWAMRELYARDIRRAPGEEKLGPAPRVYLYPEARKIRPDLSPRSLTSLLQAVSRRYRKTRLEVIWRSAAALPTFRYPMPLPVHNRAWKVERSKEGVYTLFCPLAGERWALRLRGGPHFRPQLRALDQIIAGKAHQAELTLYRVRGSDSDHRPAVADRTPGGGARVSYRVMAKVVLWLPRERREGKFEGTLVLRTAADSFWVAERPSGKPWVLNADHVRRWISEHRLRLQRMSEDTKYEKRWPKRVRLQMGDHRERFVALHHRRLKTWIDQAVASIVGLARRERVGRVEYDDRIGDFGASFPWHQLKVVLGERLAEHGITLSSAEVIAEDQGALEGET